MMLPKWATTITPLSKRIAFILFITLPILGFYLGLYYQKKASQMPKAVSVIPTETALLSPTPKTSADELITYEHPRLHYTLSYPAGWTGGTEEIPKESQTKVYEDFFIFSPDHTYSDFTNTEFIPGKGAAISIMAESTDESNIAEILDKNSLAKMIATNKKNITVNNIQAIQYDWSYEVSYGITTIFVKNGVHYSIQFTYIDEAGKQKYVGMYESLLLSFKAS